MAITSIALVVGILMFGIALQERWFGCAAVVFVLTGLLIWKLFLIGGAAN